MTIERWRWTWLLLAMTACRSPMTAGASTLTPPPAERNATPHDAAAPHPHASVTTTDTTSAHPVTHERADDVTPAPPVASVQSVTFTTSDGVTVHADLHRAAAPQDATIVLLFHQAGANGRAEYGPIVPRLVEAGYHALVVDQRSGGNRFGGENRTARALGGKEPGYCDAYPDLEAALQFVRAQGFSGLVAAWGSSYSAALVFALAAKHPGDVSAVLAFSPAFGAPVRGCAPRDFATQVSAPVLVVRPKHELESPEVRQQFAELAAHGFRTHTADPGAHGSSTLVGERVKGDTQPTWNAVLAFLHDVTRVTK